MSEMQTGNLIYLVLLGGVLLSWLLIQNRNRLGKMMQQVAAWVLIFMGTIAVIGLWDDIRGTVIPQQAVFAEEGRIEVPRSPDGHYYATLELNGVPTRFVVDTGATMIVLTPEDAGRIGLAAEDLLFMSEAMTANGRVRTAPVTVETVAIGPFVDRNVRAFVNEGVMSQSLLGMSYLQTFERMEFSEGRLVLER